MLPNFIIIGANKGGTTSLHQYISEHPEIFMSEIKEPMYFSFINISEKKKNENASSRNKGLQEAIYTQEDYENLFKKCESIIARGEASTAYLTNPKVPEKIYKLIPDVKIIAILREPISRAISNYKMYVDWGIEKHSFAKAVNDELKGKRKDKTGGMHYLALGLYADAIERYQQIFPADHIKVYLFEDFVKNTEKVLEDIYLFLGVDPTFKANIETVYNKSEGVMINSVFNKLGFVKKIFPQEIKILLKERYNIYLKKRTKANLHSDDLIAHLKKYYENDIEKLEKLIERDLSHWKSKTAWK
ncbi:MAG: sulfotransferase [Bacteroidetes bacterium]|nr:sulfotransferase [Bacteroidota bacterium]